MSQQSETKKYQCQEYLINQMPAVKAWARGQMITYKQDKHGRVIKYA